MTRHDCVITAQEDGEAHTCQTEIKLNGTHTMRGEQETRLVPHLPEYLYLGQYQYHCMQSCQQHFLEHNIWRRPPSCPHCFTT